MKRSRKTRRAKRQGSLNRGDAKYRARCRASGESPYKAKHLTTPRLKGPYDPLAANFRARRAR